MKTVFILGAGASNKAGAPLMKDFLLVADKYRRENKIPEAQKAFEDVHNAISELDHTIHSKSYLDLDNIESVFGAIEMSRIIGKFVRRDIQSIEKLHESIITVIVKTLELSMPFPVSNGKIVPPTSYKNFIDMVVDNLSERGPYNASFITFNYDLGLDYALSYRTRFDYSLSSKNEQGYPLLKLHGSLNWRICQKCQKIFPSSLQKLRGAGPLFDDKNIVINHRQLFDTSEVCCGLALEPIPFIVPPTWNKTQYREGLIPVWRRAAKELSEAENIIVIGYSYPNSDIFFKYLFALGTESPTRIRKFWIFDPKEDVENHFNDLVGQGIRKSFKFFPETFEVAINRLKHELKI